MPNPKRERQKARHRQIKKAQEAARKRQRRRQIIAVVALIGMIGTVAGALLAANDADDPIDLSAEDLDGSEDRLSDPDQDVGDGDGPPTPVAITTPPLGATLSGDVPCPPDDGDTERVTQFAEMPPMCIDADQAYVAEVETTKGSFTIELHADRAPLTVNNFVVLSRYGYYDGVSFHRIIPGFVVQGGDAVGDPPGTGNPGYRFADELPDEGDYEIGSVAMANAGPDTNGSQFFVVTGAQGVSLPPNFSLFGTVVDGLDVVLEIEAVGTASGSPTEDVQILSIEIATRAGDETPPDDADETTTTGG